MIKAIYWQNGKQTTHVIRGHPFYITADDLPSFAGVKAVTLMGLQITCAPMGPKALWHCFLPQNGRNRQGSPTIHMRDGTTRALPTLLADVMAPPDDSPLIYSYHSEYTPAGSAQGYVTEVLPGQGFQLDYSPGNPPDHLVKDEPVTVYWMGRELVQSGLRVMNQLTVRIPLDVTPGLDCVRLVRHDGVRSHYGPPLRVKAGAATKPAEPGVIDLPPAVPPPITRPRPRRGFGDRWSPPRPTNG